MTLDQLLMLTTVIDLGSVQAASQKLNKTQPAISKGLKQLEIQLQIKILDRSQYRLSLTAAGKQIYSHAKRVISEAESLEQVSNHLLRGNESTVSIAIEGSINPSILTPAILKTQKNFPNTQLIIRQEYMSGAADALINGQVDIAISPIEIEPTLANNLKHDHLTSHYLVNVATPNFLKKFDALANNSLTNVEQLKNEYLIVLQDSGSMSQGQELNVSAGQRKYYVNDFITKKNLILNHLGWGRLPEHLIEAELKDGTLTTITPSGTNNRLKLETHIITNKTLGPVATQFWQTLVTGSQVQ